MCNGFYESCGNEPICKTCHIFIYSDELLNTNAEDVSNTAVIHFSQT